MSCYKADTFFAWELKRADKSWFPLYTICNKFSVIFIQASCGGHAHLFDLKDTFTRIRDIVVSHLLFSNILIVFY